MSSPRVHAEFFGLPAGKMSMQGFEAVKNQNAAPVRHFYIDYRRPFARPLRILAAKSGGERGIRTPGPVLSRTTDFESAPFNRSGISPYKTKTRCAGAKRGSRVIKLRMPAYFLPLAPTNATENLSCLKELKLENSGLLNIHPFATLLSLSKSSTIIAGLLGWFDLLPMWSSYIV